MKATADTAGLAFTGSAVRYIIVDAGDYRKSKNGLMVTTVEWNHGGTSCFTQVARNWLLPVLLILWGPDVVSRTDENYNKCMTCELKKSELKSWNRHHDAMRQSASCLSLLLLQRQWYRLISESRYGNVFRHIQETWKDTTRMNTDEPAWKLVIHFRSQFWTECNK